MSISTPMGSRHCSVTMAGARCQRSRSAWSRGVKCHVRRASLLTLNTVHRSSVCDLNAELFLNRGEFLRRALNFWSLEPLASRHRVPNSGEANYHDDGDGREIKREK